MFARIAWCVQAAVSVAFDRKEKECLTVIFRHMPMMMAHTARFLQGGLLATDRERTRVADMKKYKTLSRKRMLMKESTRKLEVP